MNEQNRDRYNIPKIKGGKVRMYVKYKSGYEHKDISNEPILDHLTISGKCKK